MADNPFLPLSFIAGPAILTNACTVMLNGASIRYNLAIGLWRDLRSNQHGHEMPAASTYPDLPAAQRLAEKRIAAIVHGLNLLYCAVAGFAFSTLAGLVGGLSASRGAPELVKIATVATIAAGVLGLVCVLGAATAFIGESRYSIALLRLGATDAPPHAHAEL